MTDTHILRAFGDALAELNGKVQHMGVHAADMVDDACRAFGSADAALARDVIGRDMDVDHAKEAVNAGVVAAIARYQPVAVDLREVLAIEHMANNFERVADHAKGIAKRAITMGEGAPSPAVQGLLEKLHEATSASLRDALRALRREDANGSDQVIAGDSRIDALYDDLFHSAVAELKGGSISALADVQALFVGKSLERVGDHATNIAEEVRYMTRGVPPTSTRSE